MKKITQSPLAVGILITVALVSGFKLFQAFSAHEALKNEELRLRARLEFYDAENKRLRQELRVADSPEAIERDGKSRLNLKKANEKVVLVVPPAPTATSTPESRNVWQRIMEAATSWFSRQ